MKGLDGASYGFQGVYLRKGKENGKRSKGLAHVAFNVSDMERSIRFYQEAFGFEKAFELAHPNTGEPWIVYLHAAGGQFLELFYGGIHASEYKDENIGFSHICLEVSDIHAAAKRLEQAGAPLDSPVRQGMDLNWQCWTRDPDNNRIELMQMDENSAQMRFLKEHAE